jgi:hypothetical protein
MTESPKASESLLKIGLTSAGILNSAIKYCPNRNKCLDSRAKTSVRCVVAGDAGKKLKRRYVLRCLPLFKIKNGIFTYASGVILPGKMSHSPIQPKNTVFFSLKYSVHPIYFLRIM